MNMMNTKLIYETKLQFKNTCTNCTPCLGFARQLRAQELRAQEALGQHDGYMKPCSASARDNLHCCSRWVWTNK
ncbi:hypothetical protein KC19_5G136200 [Ceratodon purpureus]|uniref:Uncharacterized protein n=1 Tax=Ceratodon purpureus TaxID=3225 RepID=A0A8T0I2Z7_CERPU|nr:hypothetical protein KC19_5G136200 [Ceratodon purpureus]KAG0577171.1 hypothetical protein KC19_5G136200 [Ceratodon purpureus]